MRSWPSRSRPSEFQRRQTQWETIFHLQPPFAELGDVFPAGLLSVDAADSRLVAPAAGAPGTRRLLTTVACPAAIQMAATFDAAWEQSGRLAVVLNATPQQSYDFVLLVPTEPAPADAEAPPRPAATTFAGVRAQDGAFVVAVFRNGLPLLRHQIHHATFPPGPLTIRGTRQRGQLAIQINTLLPHRIRDPFPLSAAQPGVLAVELPAGAALRELHAERKPRPPEPSALEHGDELFDQDRYEDALAFYEQQAREATQVEFEQEARYKQASCLVALNRLDDAATLLQPLMTEAQEVWPPLAGCQLWMVRLLQKNRPEADAIYETLASRFRFEQLAPLIPESMRETILEAYQSDLGSAAGMLRYNPERVQNMERLAAIDRLFSPDGRGHPLTQMEVSRAYRFLGDQQAALRIAEPLAKGTTWPHVLRHYSRLLRFTSQARAALEELENALRDDSRPTLREDRILLVEKARVHAALGEWRECEAAIDEIYQHHRFVQPVPAGTHCYAALIKGLLLERRGATAPAQGIWREAFQAFQPQLGTSTEANADVLHGLILGSLTGELKAADAQAFYFRTIVGSGDSTVLRLAQSLFDPQTLQAGLQRMWRTDLGRRYAEGFAFETLTMRERIKTPGILAGIEYARDAGVQGDLSPEQESLYFEQFSRLFDAMFVEGRFSAPQAAQLALTWKGTTNFLGWDGLAPTLEPALRAQLAYFFGHRFLRLNNLPQATRLFETARADAEPGSVLARLAQRDLELLKSGQGWLAIVSDSAQSIPLVIRRGETVVQTVTLPQAAELALPAGDYTLDVADRAAEFRLSRAQVKLVAGAGQRVKLTWRWRPHDDGEPLPGLLLQPALAAAGGRWQLYHREPRVPGQAVAWSPDGRRIAVGEPEGLIRLLDSGTLQTVALLPGLPGGVHSLIWHPDSTSLAALTASHEIRLWSIETGALQQILAGHTGPVWCGQWSPHGDVFASGGQDRTIRWWSTPLAGASGSSPLAGDAGSGQRPNLRALAGSTGGQTTKAITVDYEVRALAFNPDGRWLAAMGWAGAAGQVIDIWDVAKCTSVRRLVAGPSPCELTTGLEPRRALPGRRQPLGRDHPLQHVHLDRCQGPARRQWCRQVAGLAARRNAAFGGSGRARSLHVGPCPRRTAAGPRGPRRYLANRGFESRPVATGRVYRRWSDLAGEARRRQFGVEPRAAR